MGFINFYDVAEMIVDSFSEENAEVLRVSPKKKENLKYYCRLLQSLSDKFDGVNFSVNINDEADIMITLTCKKLKASRDDREFIELLRNSEQFEIGLTNDGNFNISFLFDGVWLLNEI